MWMVIGDKYPNFWHEKSGVSKKTSGYRELAVLLIVQELYRDNIFHISHGDENIFQFEIIIKCLSSFEYYVIMLLCYYGNN